MFGNKRRMSQDGEQSENYQAGRDIAVYQGMSPDEVSGLLREALESNALQMRSIAKEELQNRIQDFSERFVEKTKDEPDVIQATSDPDVQAAFIEAGIGFARSGDEDLGEILIDLVADRAKQGTRTLLAVVLNDAVTIAPRLTDGEMAILTIAWRLLRTVDRGLVSLQALAGFIREISDLIPYIPRGDASYLHLQSLGCVGIGIGSISFDHVWLNSYRGLFTNGFTWEQVPEELSARRDELSPWVIPCLRDASKLQVNALNEDVLKERLKGSVLEAHEGLLVGLMNQHSMNEDKIVEALGAVEPRIHTLREIWTDTPMQHLSVTAVGMAIGHANWRHMTGKHAPLSIWINEGDLGTS